MMCKSFRCHCDIILIIFSQFYVILVVIIKKQLFNNKILVISVILYIFLYLLIHYFFLKISSQSIHCFSCFNKILLDLCLKQEIKYLAAKLALNLGYIYNAQFSNIFKYLKYICLVLRVFRCFCRSETCLKTVIIAIIFGATSGQTFRFNRYFY